ncbi:MAG: HAD-IIIC family phosphatase [bacterium]|nr:HAD-IIIC family phosphatase [bacterium]
MRIAILANVTIDLLAGLLKPAFDIYIPQGFNTWQQEILSDTSALYQYKPDAAVIILHAGACQNSWNSLSESTQLISSWEAVFQEFAAKLPHIPLFISSIDIDSNACCFGAEPQQQAYMENMLIESIQKQPGAYVLPVKELIANMGRNSFYSSKMWYWGAMPYSRKGLQALSELISRYVSAIHKRNKKCLALDLDNTLWGGVIGEDGLDGIVLADHLEGARYKDTQRLLKKMREQGVMLAILSRNNLEDARTAFAHPDMILHEDDFVAKYIDWHDKTDNIKKMAQELSIGLNAIVFLDDNPAEREHMREACPEVTVIEFPADSAKLPQTIARAYNDYFFTLEVTSEDLHKTEMYRNLALSQAEQKNAVTAEAYLKRLMMTIDIHCIKSEEIKRVTQLANKTNQFNLTGRRYSEDEICALAASRKADIVTVHLTDKYGPLGLIAVIILRYDGHKARIEQFFMSCRAMGRRVEDELMAFLKRHLASQQIDQLSASYVKTAKNTPVTDLYEQLGFIVLSSSETPSGVDKEYMAETASLPESTGLFINAV